MERSAGAGLAKGMIPTIRATSEGICYTTSRSKGLPMVTSISVISSLDTSAPE